MTLLAGRRGLIVGIANERSIAYGIARAARDAGARLAVSYQGERLHKRVTPLAEELGVEVLAACELTDEAQVASLVGQVEEHWGALDFLVHAVAYARAEDLEGRLLDTDRQGFMTAVDVSVYTLVNLARRLEPLLLKGEHSPSVLTLTYLGSERALPGYNVMGVAKAALEAAVRYLANELGPSGIRVNALSPGPIKTLSAASVRGLRPMLALAQGQAPLRRNVTIDDVGAAALFALSEMGRGMTGEIIHIDAGFNITAAPPASE